MVATLGASGAGGRRSMITLDAERARGGDLAVGRAAAAVLRDHDVDADASSSARDRRLRQTGRGRSRRSHAAAATADRPDRRCGSDNGAAARPRTARARSGRARRKRGAAFARAPAPPRARRSTSVQRSPATATHGGRRNATNGTSVCRAAATAFAEMTARIGMRRVDQHIDPLAHEIIRKPGGAAKTADCEPAPAGARAKRSGRRATASRRDPARPASRSASMRASVVPPRIRIRGCHAAS